MRFDHTYLFEPEMLLTNSESEERLKVDGHPSEEQLGNTDWYINNAMAVT